MNEYVIVAICDSTHKKNMADVWMDPVDKSIFDKDKQECPGNRVIINPGGGQLPAGLIQMMEHLPMQMQDMMGQKKVVRDPDPRNLLLIVDPIELECHGWHHRDKITVSFEKKVEKKGEP